MEFKIHVEKVPQEFRFIEEAVRKTIEEHLDKPSYIGMEVLSHVPPMPAHQRIAVREQIRRILTITVEVDITNVPLTFKTEEE